MARKKVAQAELATFASDGFVKGLEAAEAAAATIQSLNELRNKIIAQRSCIGGENLTWFAAFHEGVIDTAMSEIAGRIGVQVHELAVWLKDCSPVRKAVLP